MNVRDYAIPAGLTAAVLLLVAVDILRGGGADSSAPQGSQTVQANASSPEVIAKAWDFYKTRPYYERPREYSPIPEGLGDLRASTCGACHQQIYQEWAVSTHRRAWLDDALAGMKPVQARRALRGHVQPRRGAPVSAGGLRIRRHVVESQTYPQPNARAVSELNDWKLKMSHWMLYTALDVLSLIFYILF